MKRGEVEVHKAIGRGDLRILSNGEIWRIGHRRNNGHSSPCQPRRAEALCPNGYTMVRAMVDTILYVALSHRLVWFHFHGEIPIHLTVNHKNGIKSDNHPENLELATPSQQMLHAFRVLRRPTGRRLTDAQVAEIRQRKKSGESLAALALAFKVSQSWISMLASGAKEYAP